MVTADPRAEERVGSVLHEKWTLERLLGVGGMGAVYAARHRNGARAAVKVLLPSMGRLPHIRKRFLHEGYAANRVEHTGAVKVLDDDVIQDGEDEGTAYLVMELLDGEALSARAKREPPLTERDLLEIADGVLAVLDAAHANGVVHRDLKPDNLFLARDAEREGTQIKVLDFGLARLLEAEEQTIAGMAIGTPTYMSPEQAAGNVDEIDGRTDIYALGSILFQLVSNKRIHDAAHTLGLVVQMATTPAPKLRSVAPEASEPFSRIVDRALEFKREDRYPAAAAMRADVQAVLAMLPVGSSTINVLPASPLPASTKFLGGGWAGTSPALAATVRLPADPALAALASSQPHSDPSRAEVAKESSRLSEGWKQASPARPSRSFFSAIVFVTFAGLAGFFLWKNWPAIEGIFALSRSETTPPLSSASAPGRGNELDATISSHPDSDAAPPSTDASTLLADALDAAIDAPLDDPADASADAGDEEEDEDEDEELDASIEASTPLPLPLPSASANTRRAVPRTVTKPPAKKRPRPPAHRRHKKRWHG